MRNHSQLVFSLITAALFFCFATAKAQTTSISGKVMGEANQPLSAATVTIKNSSHTTITDDSGVFKMNNVPAGKFTLQISHVGYAAQSVSRRAGDDAMVIIMKASAANDLGSVVVVGYQKQTVRKTTSAISIVMGKEIENLPTPSFDQLLQGKVSGVNIQNFSGEPGVRNSFVVRGNSTIVTNFNANVNSQGSGSLDLARSLSTPLFVVDGFPVTVTDLDGVSSTNTNYLAGIDVNDIESIVVQKDAAATAVRITGKIISHGFRTSIT